jgi:toxin YoeB
MSYTVIVSTEAQKHIQEHVRYGRKQLLKKIDSFLAEISEHPRTGTGKPEQLRYQEGEVWSRRIDDKHRFIYQIIENELIVIAVSAAGHYGDK